MNNAVPRLVSLSKFSAPGTAPAPVNPLAPPLVSHMFSLNSQAYDAEVRRRSADAAAAPRLAAVGVRSTASAEAGALEPTGASKDAGGASSNAGVSGGGGGVDSSVSSSARVKFAESAAGAAVVVAPSATHGVSSVGATLVDNDAAGKGGGPSAWSGAGARGGGVGTAGVASDTAGASMDPVPEEGDMSITIGTGSKVPFPAAAAAAAANGAIPDGGRRGSGGGSSISGATSCRTVDTAAATHDSSAAAAAGVGHSGSVTFSSGRLSSSKGSPAPVMAAGGAGARGELTPPLGSEQTDTSISIGSGGGGDGGAHDASGLLGGSSTGGSVLGVGTAARKADKVRKPLYLPGFKRCTLCPYWIACSSVMRASKRTTLLCALVFDPVGEALLHPDAHRLGFALMLRACPMPRALLRPPLPPPPPLVGLLLIPETVVVR